ncbi:MAG: lamin tail domain-containing protein, partial [Chthoniobacteraceae bacterium]
QLRGYTDAGAKPLFSTLLAPVVSGAFGGNVAAPYNLTLTNPNAAGTIYYTINGSDPRPIGGGAPSGALTGASPISVTLNNSATLRARVYNSATLAWSPLVEPGYIVGVPASETNLVVSQIHYNPATEDGLEEFVELLNISAGNVDLTNVRFTMGIEFSFPLGYILAPGARVLIVRDLAAFTAAYPSVPPAQIAGVFANASALSNSGERLQLLGTGDVVLRDFSYDDEPLWPTTPDGLGASLVLKRPEKNPNHGLAESWRASGAHGGSPGASDALTYAQWASLNGVFDAVGTGDDDGDGSLNLVEHSLGTNPKSASKLPFTVGTQNFGVNGTYADYMTISFTRPTGRDEIAYTVEASGDLSAPWSAGVLVSGPSNNGDSTETLIYRHPVPMSGQPQQYLRIRFTRMP